MDQIDQPFLEELPQTMLTLHSDLFSQQYLSYVILHNVPICCNEGGYVRLHNLDTVVKTTHLAATYSTQPQWGVLHKSTIAVSPDPLFLCEGPASETTVGQASQS